MQTNFAKVWESLCFSNRISFFTDWKDLARNMVLTSHRKFINFEKIAQHRITLPPYDVSYLCFHSTQMTFSFVDVTHLCLLIKHRQFLGGLLFLASCLLYMRKIKTWGVLNEVLYPKLIHDFHLCLTSLS